jgi:hypothetical protein
MVKISIFWDITPCSPLKFNPCFRGICRFHLKEGRISQARNWGEAGSEQWNCLAEISDHIGERREMQEKCQFLLVFPSKQANWCCIPENSTLHNHRCENLKYYNCLSVRIFLCGFALFITSMKLRVTCHYFGLWSSRFLASCDDW